MTDFFFKSGLNVYDVISCMLIGTLAATFSWFFLVLIIPSAAFSVYIENNCVE